MAVTARMYADRKGWPLEGVEIALDIERFAGRDYPAYSGDAAFVHEVRQQITLHGPLNDEQHARLLEIASQLPPGPQQRHYAAAGAAMVDALARHCAAMLPAAGGLLTHGTYHRAAELGVEECTLWGDYYYLEALARLHHGWTSYDR